MMPDGRTSGFQCALCGRRPSPLSHALSVCPDCIRARPRDAVPIALAAHARTRHTFGLPLEPPRSSGGAACPLCGQACVIAEGARGFCGLRTCHNGRLVHLAGTVSRGVLHWYRDPLPTNCVADWVCPGRRRLGMHNLAVFYASCTLDCLFCQNWHFRETPLGQAAGMTAAELAETATSSTYCVCFFGGDPASQMPHALAAARKLAAKSVAVCWETAGTSSPKLLDLAVQLSLSSGGCIKFDLKAFDESLHVALTGASNKTTLENFARTARLCVQRPEPPLVIASTLLVPGYVDAHEVGHIARFIASLDPRIPYSLLGFSPRFCMKDLPRTSRRHAAAAEAAARAAGLSNVHIGNRHLLEDRSA